MCDDVASMLVTLRTRSKYDEELSDLGKQKQISYEDFSVGERTNKCIEIYA